MQTQTTSHSTAYLFLVLAALFWSGNIVLARGMHAAIPPFTLALVRWSLALLVLLPKGLPRMLADKPRWQGQLPRIIPTALLGITGYNTLVYFGVHSTSATNAVLLNSFIPILIVLFGALFYRMKVGRAQLIGIAISFAGVLAIVAHGSLARLLALDINLGDVVVFGAVITWALYTLRLRTLPLGLDPLGLLTLFVAIGVLPLAPLAAYEWMQGQTVALTLPNILTFLYVGTLPSVLAYYLYNYGVARIGAARAGSFIHLMPAFGALLSMLFLGETLALFHLAGIAAILAGVALSTRTGR